MPSCLKVMVAKFIGTVPPLKITSRGYLGERARDDCPTLHFFAPGANAADQARGLIAAHDCLSGSGFSAEQAKRGADARETWGCNGFVPELEPSVLDSKAADAWDGAVGAALTTCYRSHRIPVDAMLYLGDDLPKLMTRS